MSATEPEWSKPAAMAIPADGYFELERGRYGPVFPRTPACYGFSIIAKVKPGRGRSPGNGPGTLGVPSRRAHPPMRICWRRS